MRNVSDIYGKRLKSNKQLTMYERQPGGDRIQTLPAGKPSPPIDSYINRPGGGYFQLLDSDAGINLYVKDDPGIEIVDPAAQDESAALSGATSAVSDWWTNTKKAVSKQSGFLADGFDKATGDLTGDFVSVTDQIKPILYLVLAIVSVVTIKNLFD